LSGARRRRSWLLVPASRPQAIEEAAGSGTDVLVLDLIELVAERDRAAARRGIASAIAKSAAGGALVYAQIDGASFDDDLEACVRPGLAGVVVSRAESGEGIARIANRLDTLEKERGIEPQSLAILPAVETAAGNHAAFEIARASPRVSALTLGRADLVMNLRPEPSGEIHLLPHLMQRLIMIAGAAGVTPIGAWWRGPDRGLLATPQNTLEAARRGRAIGFKGAMCLLANQVEALNETY
jgi:citrate lyase subunit beta / citryl-CoA lyase